ncbi:poly(ADP-ribose) glycohydrolase domain-containing protein [Deinococcus hopiensis]|uniref:poly(ADP-ribose) glycohydrolase domain-containing protein n=1 Tax=Deinococcus hopiensis TaxID=309885 RepID=UPI0009FE207B
MKAGTRLYTPLETQTLGHFAAPDRWETHISVTRETTLAAARRLVQKRPEPVSVLNAEGTNEKSDDQRHVRVFVFYRVGEEFPAHLLENGVGFCKRFACLASGT